jgi:hypothetical protein
MHPNTQTHSSRQSRNTRQPQGTLRLYRSYNFIDKDPAIDRLRTMVQDEGLKYHEIQILSGVAETTMRNWFHGDTRMPQHATMAAVASALGYDWELVKKKKIDYEAEMPAAKRWYDNNHGSNRKTKRKTNGNGPRRTGRRPS